MVEILKAIMERKSPRAFSDKLIDKNTLLSLFEAARWAPSSFNEQPWRYIIGIKGNGGTYEKIFASLIEFNKDWAKNAPVLSVSLAHIAFEKNKKENPHAWHDVGMANQNISLQATHLGLVVHWMAGFSPDVITRSFGIPEDFKPVAVFAIGYPGNPDNLNMELKEREAAARERNPLQSFLFYDRWDNPWQD